MCFIHYTVPDRRLQRDNVTKLALSAKNKPGYLDSHALSGILFKMRLNDVCCAAHGLMKI